MNEQVNRRTRAIELALAHVGQRGEWIKTEELVRQADLIDTYITSGKVPQELEE